MPGSQAQPEATSPLASEEQAAAIIGVSKLTLQRWRLDGDGPPHLKIHGVIRYSREAVVAWALKHSATVEGGR